MKKYIVTRHINSNGSKRRREHLEAFKKGESEVVRLQMLRCGDNYEGGESLPHSPAKPSRSRYRPHVGAKQKLKTTRRSLRDPKASLALNA